MQIFSKSARSKGKKTEKEQREMIHPGVEFYPNII